MHANCCFFIKKEGMHNYLKHITLFKYVNNFFNWSNEQIIILEDINRINFKIIEVIFDLVCIFEFYKGL